MRCSVFCGISLDGFIARKDHSIDWLEKIPFPKGEDGGYKKFIKTVDVLIMGRKTYEKVLTFGFWPYKKPIIVLSKKRIKFPKHITKVSHSSQSPQALLRRLSKEGYKHAYVDGGITIQRFMRQGLIDEMTLTVLPVLLGEGIPLFGALSKDQWLSLKTVRKIGKGFVQFKYKKKR
jgi:dihydrofolate reductase